MKANGKQTVMALFLLLAIILGCRGSKKLGSNTNTEPANANTETTPKTDSGSDGIIPSGTGVEKEKPAPGKGNVQGRVLYNGQPAPGIEVKLCEKFNQYFGGCGGEIFTTKTDSNGEYLIKNVTPRIYEGLLARVFTTNYYVFATSGIVQTAKYKIQEGQSFIAPDTNLFKHDLRLVAPKAGTKTGPDNIEVKWDNYPDAAYYKFSIFADSSSGAATEYDFINKRVDGLSYVLEKPLTPGSYSVKVEAYNANDSKLSQSADDIKFTVAAAK